MPKILPVEDYAWDSDRWSRRPAKKGHDVTVAMDGEPGVMLARALLQGLVLMDMGLPGINGWEAPRPIKACELPGISPSSP